MTNDEVNTHRAQMFDAIREFFVTLTCFTKIGMAALEAQLQLEAQRRK